MRLCTLNFVIFDLYYPNIALDLHFTHKLMFFGKLTQKFIMNEFIMSEMLSEQILFQQKYFFFSNILTLVSTVEKAYGIQFANPLDHLFIISLHILL